MKNMPDTFSIDFACLQISPFETVILYSFWDIPQIKTVKPPDKKPSISDRYSFLHRRSVKFQFVWQKQCYNIPLAELLQKHVELHDSSAKCQNSFVCLRKMCLMVWWKRTLSRNDDLWKPCQCRQLNPLSTQINIYCLITNQTPALLVQRASWTRAAVMLLQSLYFSRPPPPRVTCIISDVRPLSHLKIKMAAINCKTRYITTVISRKNRGLWTVYFAQHPLSTPESFVGCRLRYSSWMSEIWSRIRRGAGRQKPWRFAQ